MQRRGSPCRFNRPDNRGFDRPDSSFTRPNNTGFSPRPRNFSPRHQSPSFNDGPRFEDSGSRSPNPMNSSFNQHNNKRHHNTPHNFRGNQRHSPYDKNQGGRNRGGGGRGGGGRGGGRGGHCGDAPIEAYFSPDMLTDPWKHLMNKHDDGPDNDAEDILRPPGEEEPPT